MGFDDKIPLCPHRFFRGLWSTLTAAARRYGPRTLSWLSITASLSAPTG